MNACADEAAGHTDVLRSSEQSEMDSERGRPDHVSPVPVWREGCSVRFLWPPADLEVVILPFCDGGDGE